MIFLLKEIWNAFLVFFYLDLFGMNSTLDNNLSSDNNLSIPRIQSHYFSPHSLNQYSRWLNKDRLENSPAFVHNNNTSLNRNIEKLTSHYLNKSDFPFNIIGVTETKITKSNEVIRTTKIPGNICEKANKDWLIDWLINRMVCTLALRISPIISDVINISICYETSRDSISIVLNLI